VDNTEEGVDDVKSSCPIRSGLHTYYNAADRGQRASDGKQIPETAAQFRLQAATRLHEGGIASNRRQHTAVNTFPGLVHTARHTMGVGHARSRYPNLTRRGASKVGLMTGVKS
jgi:hypothetical protein